MTKAFCGKQWWWVCIWRKWNFTQKDCKKTILSALTSWITQTVLLLESLCSFKYIWWRYYSLSMFLRLTIPRFYKKIYIFMYINCWLKYMDKCWGQAEKFCNFLFGIDAEKWSSAFILTKICSMFYELG